MTDADLSIDGPLRRFATAGGRDVQSQTHIKAVHRYVALRLVLEGGFLPQEVTPHPPLRAKRRSAGFYLEHDPGEETTGELTVFGGMKTKQIDVVVAREHIGPVLAVSVKGTLGAYRNLTNRMEEAIGDSTNVHVMYPGLVYGFLHLLRANREASGYDKRDYGVASDGQVSPLIVRYFAALCEMTGRRFVRNDFTRYESVGLALVENGPGTEGTIHQAFPPPDSPLRIESFFKRLYEVYDLRFPLRAQNMPAARRIAWHPDSPLFQQVSERASGELMSTLGYWPRLT